MARTNSPVESTYSTKRVSFITSPLQRSGTLPNKDARLVNVMVEVVDGPDKNQKKYYLKSRAGLSTVDTVAAGVGRGTYRWVMGGTEYRYIVVGNTVYVNGVANTTLTTSTGYCGFTEYINGTNTRQLVMLDGTNGYVWTTPGGTAEPIIPPNWAASTAYTTGKRVKPTVSNNFFYEATTGGTSSGTQPTWPTVEGNTVVDGTVTWTCRGGSFPTPHVPHPVFINAYLFVAKKDTADIYNSNLNEPLRWTAGDFISAEMYPGNVVSLAKNNNYLYAIGDDSVEYFYDAANATGTPLARHDSAVQQFGCVAPSTVIQTEKEVIFIGETDNGGHTVWTIDGFKEREIGNPMVKGVLLAEGAALANATAFCVRVSNQKLYVICLTSRTLVYSFDTTMWHEWDCGASGGSVFLANYGTDGPGGAAYVLDRSSGRLYAMSETYLDDAGTNFQNQWVLDKEDFGTMNRKFMSRLSIIGDIPDYNGASNAITVDWSDDDYNTWSPTRSLSFNFDFPMITQLGNFRRRAFRFRYSAAKLIRLEGIEVDINVGSQ
jgi:hypothetical protein